jgi:acetylornithine/succinyldiaminopimelate/putrescine aminotransferase
MGKRLHDGLSALIRAHPGMIKSVQGRGLLLALELDSAAKAVEFVRELSGRGVLAMAGEVKKSSLILRPSLLIHADDVEAVTGAVAASVEALEKRR